MAEPDWEACPDCGTSVKRDNLKRHRAEVHQGPGGRIRWPWVVAVGVIVIILGGLLLRAGDPAPVELSADEDPYWGQEDAPHEAFLFADYQCPHCREFELGDGLDAILTNWVETGQVRLVLKDLIVLGEHSILAAQASQIVWDLAPETWPDWNRFVFERQEGPQSGWASHDGLVALAREFDRFDVQAFEERLGSNEYRGEVLDDNKNAIDAGITSTPMLVIDGTAYRATDRDVHGAFERMVG